MTSLLVVTVLAHVALLLEIAAHNQTLSPVIGDKRWKNQHANAKCRMTWGLKCDLICRQCCHGRFSSKLLTFQNKSIFYSAKSSKNDRELLNNIERADRLWRDRPPSRISLLSEQPPDILPVYSKSTPDVSHQRRVSSPDTSIHSAATVLGPSCSTKRLRDTVCTAGWAVSASGRANKQLLKRTAVGSDVFGEEHGGWAIPLWVCLLCSFEHNIPGMTWQRTLPRMDRWWSESNHFSTTRTET